MDPTPEQARAFYEEHEHLIDPHERARLKRHSLLVAMSAARLVPQREGLMLSAGWLHDVGRVHGAEGHAERSLSMTEDRFGDLSAELRDAIQNHGSKAQAKTWAGRALQLADKLSILDPEQFLESWNKDPTGTVQFYRKHLERLIDLAERHGTKPF